MKDTIQNNQRVWDAVSDQFINASALPIWGPFSIGEDLDLIPEIKGKTFLEIGCGSGKSIKYLTDRGASRVYGLDLSEKQIEESSKHNKEAIEKGVVELIQAPMEDKLTIEPVDVVYSVYGFGWTQDPKTTLKHIYSYLKPGGLFIWSWDHTFFTDVRYKDGEFVVEYSYHDDKPIAISKWMGSDLDAHITYRKSATWFQLQRDAGFDIIGYYEPEPRDLTRAHTDPTKHYSKQKAEKVPSSFIFKCQKPYVKEAK